MIDMSQVVALLMTDKNLFKTRQMDRELNSQNDRYICLLLKDLIWIHNLLINELVKERRKRNEGRVTSQGK